MTGMMPAQHSSRRLAREDRITFRRATRREVAARIGIVLGGVLLGATAGALVYGIAVMA